MSEETESVEVSQQRERLSAAFQQLEAALVAACPEEAISEARKRLRGMDETLLNRELRQEERIDREVREALAETFGDAITGTIFALAPAKHYLIPLFGLEAARVQATVQVKYPLEIRLQFIVGDVESGVVVATGDLAFGFDYALTSAHKTYVLEVNTARQRLKRDEDALAAVTRLGEKWREHEKAKKTEVRGDE